MTFKTDKPVEVYALEALGYFYRYKDGKVYMKEDAPEWVQSLSFFSSSTVEDVAHNLYHITTGNGEKKLGYEKLLKFIRGYATDMDALDEELEQEAIQRDAKRIFDEMGLKPADE